VTLLSRALDWTATGAAATGVFASLAAFDVIQRLALRRGPEAHQRAVSGMATGVNWSTRLAGTRLRCEGLAHVDFRKNYIIVSNHQSLLDISMASQFLAPLQPRYVSKRELARGIPGVSYNLSHGGSANIDRKDPDQARKAIEALGAHVRNDGWSVVIFPEGTRSKTGEMRAWRDGGLKTLLACAPDVSVLPVTSTGGSRLFSRNLKPIVRNVELVFRIHAPMQPPKSTDPEVIGRFIREIEATIRSGLPA
jgi:1-acyl-sn-glycerol-3-phosphate acyltransferase